MAATNFSDFRAKVPVRFSRYTSPSPPPETVEYVDLQLIYMYEQELLTKVGVVKGISFRFFTGTTEITTAEVNSDINDAIHLYRLMSANGAHALEFQSVVQKLSAYDRLVITAFVDFEYHLKVAPPGPNDPEVAQNTPGGGGGDDGSQMKIVIEAIAAALVKILGDEMAGVFGTPASKGPVEKAVAGAGVAAVVAGMILHRKKQALARSMVKLGGIAIGFAIVYPMAASLPAPHACAFVVLIASIMAAAVALG